MQLRFGAVAETKVTKAIAGPSKKARSMPTAVIKEFALESADEQVQPGSNVGPEMFENLNCWST